MPLGWPRRTFWRVPGLGVPELNRVFEEPVCVGGLTVAAGQHGTARAKLERRDPELGGAPLRQPPPRLEVPLDDIAISGARGQPGQPRVERQGVDSKGMAYEPSLFAPTGEFVETHLPRSRGRGQQVAVGTEDDIVHEPGAWKDRQCLTGVGVPNPRRVVDARGGDPPAVGLKARSVTWSLCPRRMSGSLLSSTLQSVAV